MSSNFIPTGVTSITLAPSGSTGYRQYVDLVMEDWKFVRFVSEVTYAATAATTGVAIDLYGGMGTLAATASGSFPQVFWGSTIPSQPNLHMGDNAVAVSMVAPTAGSGSAQTTKTSFYFDYPQIRLPGIVRLRFTNSDATNAATFSLYADVS
jgi:hypothetical protein